MHRRGKSAEQLLLVAVDYITQALDRVLTTCVAFLDLRKAFDSLDHHILLWRLHDLGVGGVSGLLNIFLIAIKELNFIIPILHGDWLEVVTCTKTIELESSYYCITPKVRSCFCSPN